MDVPQPQTLKFGLLSSAVTLKIKARSPKPNQAMLCPCKFESDLAHKITCTQESDTLLGLMLTQGSYRQVLVKFKDFSRPSKSLSNSFQGLNGNENTDLRVESLLQKC